MLYFIAICIAVAALYNMIMSSLTSLPIDSRIKIRLIKIIHTFIYKNTSIHLSDLLDFKTCVLSLINSSSKILTLPIASILATEKNMAGEIIWLHLRGTFFR